MTATADQPGEPAAAAGLGAFGRRRFDELDMFGQCLAVTETMAHLDVLTDAARLRRTDEGGVRSYTVA